MFFKAVLFLYFFLLATAANAGPLVAAVTAIGTAISTAVSAAPILGLVLRTAVGLGLSLLQKALTKQKNQQSVAGSVLEVKMGDDQPMTFPVGSRAVGGRRKYIGSWGSANGTPNAYLTDVIEVSNLPSYAGAQGIASIWVGQQKCDIQWDKPASDGRGYPIKQFVKSNGTAYMWIKYYDGTQTVADPFLVAKFGTHPDRPYTSDRIGRGCQYIIVTTRLDNDLQLGGSPPEVLVEPRPTPMYDPRKDSTNGGSGSHRYGNWATYEPTLNPMVIAYNIARGIYYTPDEWVFGGQNVAAIRLPNSAWFASMNECDRDNGSGAAQYRCGLEIQCDQEPLDIIEDLRIACAGRLAEVGGIMKPLVGAPGAAVYSFDDSGIIITDEQDFEPFPSLTSTHNSISGTYPEPSQRWTVTDAPEQRNLDQEAEDGQRSLPAPVRFDAVPYSDQVQHLMKTMAAEQRRFRIHTITLPPSAYALEPNDVVAWTSVRNSYTNKKFIVTAVTGRAGMLQRVTLLEIDPTDYDPPSFYVPAPDGWIGPINAPSQPMYGWQVEPATINDSAGVPWRPSIKISCAPDQDDVVRVWVQVRLAATGEIVFDSDSTRYETPYSWILNANFKGSTDYEARGRFIPSGTRATDWSAWLPVTTPNVVITDLVVDLQHVKNDILDRFKGLQKELQDMRPLVEQLMINTQLSDAVLDAAQRSLVASVGQSNATFTENIQVVADAANAAASQVVTLTATVAGNKASADSQIAAVSGVANSAAAQATSLSATVGDLSAQGLVKFAVAANQTGVDARFSIALRTQSGASYVESGMFLEIYTTGGVQKSRFSVMANQFSILNPDNLGQSFLPVVVEGGVLKAQFANIGTVTAGLINGGPGAKMVIDITNGAITVSD